MVRGYPVGCGGSSLQALLVRNGVPAAKVEEILADMASVFASKERKEKEETEEERGKRMEEWGADVPDEEDEGVEEEDYEKARKWGWLCKPCQIKPPATENTWGGANTHTPPVKCLPRSQRNGTSLRKLSPHWSRCLHQGAASPRAGRTSKLPFGRHGCQREKPTQRLGGPHVQCHTSPTSKRSGTPSPPT